MAPILTWPSRFFMGKTVLSLSQETLQPTLTNWRLSLCQNLTISHQKLHQLVCQGLDQEDLLVFIRSLERVRKRGSDSSRKKEHSPKGGSSEHEVLGNEWLESGNCPIAKSYRAVSGIVPLVAAALRPPPGIKLKCPPAVVAARAALARTALVKTMRPRPLPAKVLAIGCLGIAANIPLGVWREHTKKFSVSWFTAVHAAVPFIAMLRKSVLMPKTAMALTIAGSILGQMIGSRAERLRLKAKAERAKLVAQASPAVVSGYGSVHADVLTVGNCGTQGAEWDPLSNKIAKISSPPPSVCF